MSLPTYAVGVDIGGSYTKAGVVDSAGEVICQEVLQTISQGEAGPYLLALQAVIHRLAKQYSVCGIGLSLPGFLSENRQVIVYNPNTPALVGLDFGSLFSYPGLPVAFEADLNTPALAEFAFGERSGCRRLLTAVIGTGLGAAVMIDGELVRLDGGVAGDNGHIILQPGGPSCTAGCQGCAEALVSAPAIARAFEAAVSNRPPGSNSLNFSGDWESPTSAPILTDIEAGVPTARAVIQHALLGNRLAQAILSEVGGWLGQWLAGLAAIFLPEVIILCGGVSEAGELLRHPADLRMRQLAGPKYTGHCELLTGKFRGQAGLIGATVPIFFGEKR